MRKFMLALSIVVSLLMVVSTALAGSDTAVVVVDVQADFTTHHKGSLAVSGTDKEYLNDVVAATNELKQMGLPIYATQDWHPENHMSFATNQKGGKPFQMITLADGRKQVLWPDHCVQGTDGANILLDNSQFTAIVKKGMDHRYDSYSGFRDDGGADTEMTATLKAAGVKNIIVYGIATDYCVKATAIDGAKAGFKVFVVKDLCRGVAPETSKAAWPDMEKAGVTLWPQLDESLVKGL